MSILFQSKGDGPVNHRENDEACFWAFVSGRSYASKSTEEESHRKVWKHKTHPWSIFFYDIYILHNAEDQVCIWEKYCNLNMVSSFKFTPDSFKVLV